MIQIHPIGYFYSCHLDKYDVPRQPTTKIVNEGIIELNAKSGFEQALEGLKDFDRIWVLFQFNQNKNWKPKVLPPRGGKKQGVFATRSPHRPNFIGLSSVELLKVEGLKLYIRSHDILNGSPILDIKPYINYIDSIQAKKQGWLDELQEEKEFSIVWSSLALEQCHLIEDFIKKIEMRLKINPFPYPNNRIKKIEDHYVIAYKNWRIKYQFTNEDSILVVDVIDDNNLSLLNLPLPLPLPG